MEAPKRAEGGPIRRVYLLRGPPRSLAAARGLKGAPHCCCRHLEPLGGPRGALRGAPVGGPLGGWGVHFAFSFHFSCVSSSSKGPFVCFNETVFAYGALGASKGLKVWPWCLQQQNKYRKLGSTAAPRALLRLLHANSLVQRTSKAPEASEKA